MKIYVKNMVCRHCVAAVERIVQEQGLNAISVRLGEIELTETLKAEQTKTLDKALQTGGFCILTSRETRMCEQIRNELRQLVYQKSHLLADTAIPDYLQEQVGMSYSTLRKLFIDVEGRTIDAYLISVKVERAKELLCYGEKTINEIALGLGYSSASHFSTQFKQQVGVTPKEFRSSQSAERKFLDQI